MHLHISPGQLWHKVVFNNSLDSTRFYCAAVYAAYIYFSVGHSRFPRLIIDFYSVPCQDCRVPHKDCLVCQAYFKVYGNEFLQYRFGPDRQLRSTSTPSLTSYHTLARARHPDSAPTSNDVAYSRPLSEGKKIFHAESEGYSSYKDSSSNSDEMHERVKKLLAKTKVYSVSLLVLHRALIYPGFARN